MVSYMQRKVPLLHGWHWFYVDKHFFSFPLFLIKLECWICFLYANERYIYIIMDYTIIYERYIHNHELWQYICRHFGINMHDNISLFFFGLNFRTFVTLRYTLINYNFYTLKNVFVLITIYLMLRFCLWYMRYWKELKFEFQRRKIFEK